MATAANEYRQHKNVYNTNAFLDNELRFGVVKADNYSDTQSKQTLVSSNYKMGFVYKSNAGPLTGLTSPDCENGLTERVKV